MGRAGTSSPTSLRRPPPSSSRPSTTTRISNSLGQQLTRDPLAQPTHGRWVLEPPTTIANGESGWLWLQDELGGAGTLGNVSYNGDLRYDFACPFVYLADNVVGGPGSDFVARSGADAWLPKGKVPPKGHPLQAKFNLVAADVDASFSGVCGQNSFATSGIGLLPGATLKLNGATALQGCIQGNSGACVYSITLAEGSFMGGVYQYRITIDGQGPKGLGSGSMYLRFTDRSGDVYTKSFYSSSRHTLTLDYNSDGPVIWKVEWSNT